MRVTSFNRAHWTGCVCALVLIFAASSCEAQPKGDVNGDGVVDGNDIPIFVDVVTNPGLATPDEIDRSDTSSPDGVCDPDSIVDHHDVNGMIFFLLEGTCNFVPQIVEGAGPLSLFVMPGSTCPGIDNQINLSAQDFNASNALLQWSISTLPTNGVASFVGTNTGGNVTLCYQPNGAAWTSDSFVVSVSDGQGGVDTIQINPAGPQVIYRINCGGTAYTDPAGHLWSTDTGFYNIGTANSISASTEINGTNADPLYRSERWDSAAAPEMMYSFPVQAGTYRVRLHFAEIFWSLPNRRIFNVSIENQTVLTNYDIVAAVGPMTADVREFEVQVTDGTLNIQFIHVFENPKVSAIEIESGPAPLAPVIAEGANASMTVAMSSTCANGANRRSLTASDPDGSVVQLTWSVVTPPATGAISFVGGTQTGGAVTVCYTPNPSQVVPDSFVIRVTDAAGLTDSITFNVGFTGAPALSASPPSVVFGAIQVGSSSSPTNVVLQNTGQANATITAINLAGAAAADFSKSHPALPVVLTPNASMQVSVTFSPSASGTRDGILNVSASEIPAGLSVPLTGSGFSAPGGAVALYRVNCGGPAYLDPQNNQWTTDTGYYNVGGVFSITDPINGTDLDVLYQTERFDTTSNAPDMTYSFAVDPGSYLVRLHFAEIYGPFSDPGDRVFNVAIEGQTVLQNFDIAAQVGLRTALIKEFQSQVNDGSLNISFTHIADHPKISAIEIIQTNAGQLVATPDLIEWGHVGVGEIGPTHTIQLVNPGTAPITISSIDFLITSGVGHDFRLTLAGTDYTGGHDDETIQVNVQIGPGQTLNAPVVFLPTEEEDNDVLLRFSGDFASQSVRLRGTGGEEEGHPFLHVVIDAPPFAVDYDGNSQESIFLDGTDSHTHELGHVLTGFTWKENNVTFATTPTTTRNMSVGTHVVSLTIADDNVPPETLTGSATIKVVPPSAVPGVLALYYESATPAALLDAVPANAQFGEILPETSLTATTGLLGTSPYSGSVMVRLVGQINITIAGTYTFQATGGSDRRLLINGALVSSPVALSPGIYNIEGRFAVVNASQAPLNITHAFGGGSQAAIPQSALSHDQTTMKPVLNTCPSAGLEAGGEAIEITGLGFFPANQVVVHWGAQNITGAALTITPTKINFTAPPGTGLINVTIQTPQGTSNARQYNYNISGPAPIVFTLTDLVNVSSPTSADWGQDGRLYVAGLNGIITAYTFDDNYNITGTQTISTLVGLANKQILGIATNPFDQPGPVRLYVSHSLLYANGGACFTGTSPYSGQVSVLTGPNFNTIQPLITGLPVSNHDHGINGLQFDNNCDLLICVGGNTNAGVRHCNMGDLPESPLSAAVLKAKTSKSNFNGQIVYQLTAGGATSTDQVFGGVVDVASGVDISVFGAGVRNPYDIAFSTSGKLYGTDNGPNSGFGAASTSATTEGPHPQTADELLLIEENNYYGSPNRNRGRYDNRQNIYRNLTAASIPGEFTQCLTTFDASTDGIVEYRANTFNGAMRGNLLAQKWNGQTYRVTLSADGRSVLSKQNLPVSLNSLDVVTGPGGVLLGMNYSSGKLVIARPNATAGVAVYDIFPWRAHKNGGTSFVIGGNGFGNMGNTTVTIGGTPATLTSVSGTRIRGTIPASPNATSALLDVVVTVSGQSRLLTQGFRYLMDPGQEQAGGSWQTGTPMSVSVGEVAAGIINGKMYIVGENSNATVAYDFVAGTWTAPAALSVRPNLGHHHVAETFNGKWYLFGGLGSGSPGKVQIYDPVANSWTTGTNMPFLAGSCSSAVIGSEIYLCGGIVSGSTVTNLAKYNPTTNSWTSLAPMPQGRNHAASATDGTKLYIFGGRGPGSGDDNVVANGFNGVQIYTPATNTWVSSLDAGSTLAPLPQARGGMGKAVYHNGEFYIMGGETQNGAGATPDNVYSRVDIYNPMTNTWRLGTPMPTAKHGIFPLFHNGKIHVAGGGPNSGFAHSTVYEIYTP